MNVTRGTPTAEMSSVRWVNVILGAWLFISAFAWTHTDASRTNAWILGLLCIIFALGAMRVPMLRYANTVLAIWLFISAWALPHVSTGTVWNSVLVAIAIFVVSLIPSAAGRGATPAGPIVGARG